MKKKKLSKLKSGQYPDSMTQVTLGSEQQKKKFTSSFWKTVSIYPRSAPDY